MLDPGGTGGSSLQQYQQRSDGTGKDLCHRGPPLKSSGLDGICCPGLCHHHPFFTNVNMTLGLAGTLPYSVSLNAVSGLSVTFPGLHPTHHLTSGACQGRGGGFISIISKFRRNGVTRGRDGSSPAGCLMHKGETSPWEIGASFWLAPSVHCGYSTK